MKKIIVPTRLLSRRGFSTALAVGILLLAYSTVEAVSPSPTVVEEKEATASAEAESGAEATKSAALEKLEQKKPSITEPTEEVLSPLEKALKEQEVRPLSLDNFLRHAIRNAVDFGVPANTIILLLLLPLVAALIAAARHFVGIAGFGIFTPAMIAVAFLATGITSGLAIFLVTLLMAIVGKMVLKKFKVHYLPRMAILLWFICLGIFCFIFAFPEVSIFPILFMILLVENFIEVQAGRSMREAVGMTVETLMIALGCYFLMNWRGLQRFVLLNPEMAVFGVLVFNVMVGKYAGFRLLEYQRFKAAARK